MPATVPAFCGSLPTQPAVLWLWHYVPAVCRASSAFVPPCGHVRQGPLHVAPASTPSWHDARSLPVIAASTVVPVNKLVRCGGNGGGAMMKSEPRASNAVPTWEHIADASTCCGDSNFGCASADSYADAAEIVGCLVEGQEHEEEEPRSPRRQRTRTSQWRCAAQGSVSEPARYQCTVIDGCAKATQEESEHVGGRQLSECSSQSCKDHGLEVILR